MLEVSPLRGGALEARAMSAGLNSPTTNSSPLKRKGGSPPEDADDRHLSPAARLHGLALDTPQTQARTKSVSPQRSPAGDRDGHRQ